MIRQTNEIPDKIILFFMFFVCGGLFSHNTPPINFSLGEHLCKMKVSYSKIVVLENGIYYRDRNQDLVPLTGVHFEDGVCMAIAPKSIFEDLFGVWWCYQCQNWNSRFDLACIYCGGPR